MSITYFNRYPKEARVGALLSLETALLEFMGGDASDPANWKLVTGSFDGHPDVSKWGRKHEGATWRNNKDGRLYSWDGNSVVPGEIFDETRHDWDQMRKLVKAAGEDVSVLQPTLRNVMTKWYANLTRWFS